MKQKFAMPDGEILEKDMPQWKTPWNHDTNFESDRTAFYSSEPSLTKQEFANDADINVILNRFAATREPPPIVLPEHFGDTTENPTYYEMAERTATAYENFYKLPASTRSAFQNDPSLWADAVVQASDSNDRETLRNLGIHVPPESHQEPNRVTPVQGGPPAPAPVPTAPGGPEGGAAPKPPTDSGK